MSIRKERFFVIPVIFKRESIAPLSTGFPMNLSLYIVSREHSGMTVTDGRELVSFVLMAEAEGAWG